jgi:hypothetical protein
MRFLPVLFLLIASCQTWDKNSCDSIDFLKYGQLDASEGNAYSRFARYDYVGSCAKIDRSYQAQYASGVELHEKKICNYDGGVAYGRAGHKVYEGMCAKYDRAAFNRGFESGYKDLRIKELERELQKAKNENTCHSDSDCRKDHSCRFGKCEP